MPDKTFAVVTPLLLAETDHGGEVMAAPRIFVGEDVLVEPVPVEIVVGIARIAFLPLVGNHAGIDAAALVEVEIGVDVGGESEPFGQPDLETLVEIDLVVLGAVGGVLDLRERTFLSLEDARERPVGIIEIKIGTARKHGRHELALVDAVLLRIAQRDAAVEREPAVGVVIGVETGREALEPGVGHDTALVVIARGAVVLDLSEPPETLRSTWSFWPHWNRMSW